MKKTAEEIKNEVAKRYNKKYDVKYLNWHEMETCLLHSDKHEDRVSLVQRFNIAMEEYASQSKPDGEKLSVDFFKITNNVEFDDTGEPLYTATQIVEAIQFALNNSQSTPAKVEEEKMKKEWHCNACNFSNFTSSVSEQEIEQELHSCIHCGGFEFTLR